MIKVADIELAMQRIAPLALAETWDNVGLLVGDRRQPIDRLMCCLTVTEKTADEAIASKAGMIVSHHPIPFRPLQRVLWEDPTGRLLLKLIRAGVAVYSPHTAWDNARQGINQQLAEIMRLDRVEPLIPSKNLPGDSEGPLGTGRVGEFLETLSPEGVFRRLKEVLPIIRPCVAGDLQKQIRRIGIVCGSGASLLGEVHARGCDAMLTGEATYHHCLEAEHRGMALLLIGHHASERFAMERLSVRLKSEFDEIEVWSSFDESDPVVEV